MKIALLLLLCCPVVAFAQDGEPAAPAPVEGGDISTLFPELRQNLEEFAVRISDLEELEIERQQVARRKRQVAVALGLSTMALGLGVMAAGGEKDQAAVMTIGGSAVGAGFSIALAGSL